MVTAQHVKEAVTAAKITYVLHHDCGVCGEWVSYLVQGENLYFDSSCGCVRSHLRVSSWEDAAEWINMQSNEEAKAEIMKKFGLTPVTETNSKDI